MSNTNKKPVKKTPAKKAAAKKPVKKAAAKKTVAKKTAAKKNTAKKPAETKKPRTTTSTTLVDAIYEAVITTPEVQEKIEFVSDKIEEVTSVIRMNDVKSASIRKKMIAWFRKK